MLDIFCKVISFKITKLSGYNSLYNDFVAENLKPTLPAINNSLIDSTIYRYF